MNKLTNQVLVAQAFLSAFVATRMHTAAQRREERGVVSIEYIVLGAAIIILIGVLSGATDVQKALKDAFTKLFNDAG